MCFYQLTSKSNNKEKIDIINVYAPTNIQASSKPEELEEFYINLKSCMKNLKSNIWFIGGDFNSKIGKNMSSTQGGHNKGCQNNNGLILEEFMQENNLFASNTASKKQSKKKTTWVGHLRGKTVYNVIDFILIHQKLKKFLKDSNTYRGTLTQSDHNLLIVQIKNPNHINVGPTNQKTTRKNLISKTLSPNKPTKNQ